MRIPLPNLPAHAVKAAAILAAVVAMATPSAASPFSARPFVEIAAGYPEAVDFRFGAEAGPFGAALGTGLPVLAWSKVLRDDPDAPTAWNPSLTLFAHFGQGSWRFGPEAQVLYFLGTSDEYAATGAVPDTRWARWRLDMLCLKQSFAVRRGFGSWYAQAALGWTEVRAIPIRTEGQGDVKAFRHPWEYHPAPSLSFGRGF